MKGKIKEMSFNHPNPFHHLELFYRPNIDKWSFECENCGLESSFASNSLEYLVAQWYNHLINAHGLKIDPLAKETCPNCNDDGYIPLHGSDMFMKCDHVLR